MFFFHRSLLPLTTLSTCLPAPLRLLAGAALPLAALPFAAILPRCSVAPPQLLPRAAQAPARPRPQHRRPLSSLALAVGQAGERRVSVEGE